jgi:hypothetical protein
MALTAEQHAQLATAYEKAAADCLASPEQQSVLVRQANCSRILARLAEKNELAARQLPTPPEFLKRKKIRLSFALERLLAFVR